MSAEVGGMDEKDGLMRRSHMWIESHTGLLFGTYRPQQNPWGRLWLAIAPRQGSQMFSVIVGERGFYAGRVTARNSAGGDA